MVPTIAAEFVVFANERTLLSVAIPIEVNDRLASYFADRIYNLLRIIGDAQEGGQSLHYQHLGFGKRDRFRLSFLRFHCLDREFRPSFLGFYRPMKAVRDRVSAGIQQPYEGRCAGKPRKKPGPFYCQVSITFLLSLPTSLFACSRS